MPLAGVEVWAMVFRNNAWTTVKYVQTAGDGSYDLGSLSAGTHRWLSATAGCPIMRNSSTSTPIRLKTGATLRFRLRALSPASTWLWVRCQHRSWALRGGKTCTNSRNVTLAWAGTQNPAQMTFGHSGTWTPWLPFSASVSYVLPAGDGLKTIDGTYANVWGALGTTQAKILLDTVGPKCYAHSISVVRGRTCKLRADVVEMLSDKVWASIAIKALSGATKLKWSLGSKTHRIPTPIFRSLSRAIWEEAPIASRSVVRTWPATHRLALARQGSL